MGQPGKIPDKELLAPAGSTEAFFAALENGADAVYCGLKAFSARAKAKNFTMHEVERLTGYAHRRHRKLYVTLNTLLKEQDLPLAIETLAGLAGAGVDGIIIQDLGLWRLARANFPELALHASTQMTVHNAAGVMMLEKMGFVRAVLARELSLAEIGEIRRTTTIELEHFVHGALCYSISGQCLFSSFISGMSGNRGRCAQPCRRRFHNRRQPGYYFSTNDFSAIELVPELIRAGVMSFKIEGRMKSAEYVARVVAAYRLMLDAPAMDRKHALAQAREQLALSFGRQTTKGFLTGFAPTNLVVASQEGTLGRPLGTVASLRDGMVGLTVSERLHVGDRLRIQPQDDQAGVGFTVRELFVGNKQAEKKKVKAVQAAEFVQIGLPVKGRFRVGDKVFKVGGKQAFTLSSEACADQLAREKIAPRAAAERAGIRQRAEKAVLNLLPPGEGRISDALELTVSGCMPAAVSLLDDPGIGRLELPLTPESFAAAKKLEKQVAGRKGRVIWALPPILFGAQWDEYRRAVRMLVGQGYENFRLANLGHLPMFAGLPSLRLLGGFRCYAMNSQAILAWRELGLVELTVNLEDDRKNIRSLQRVDVEIPLAVTVYGAIPVLLSRIPLRGVRTGAVLRTDKGEGFRVSYGEGLTEVRAEEDFSLLGKLPALREMGCRLLLVDLSHCGCTSKKGQEVLAAFRGEGSLTDTVTFNFDRGLD